MLDMLKDGFGLALVAIGFVCGALVHAAVYIWRNSVPDDQKPEDTGRLIIKQPDPVRRAPVDEVPMVYVTFTVALLGIVSMVALTLGWLE